MYIVGRNGQGKIIMFLGQTLIMSSLTQMLLHFQDSSSLPCYNPILPCGGLGDDPYHHVKCVDSTVFLLQICKSVMRLKVLLKTPQFIMLECVPGKMKIFAAGHKCLVLLKKSQGTSVHLPVCRWSCYRACKRRSRKQLMGKERSKDIGWQLKLGLIFIVGFFLYFVPFFSFQFRCVSCSPILVLRIDCYIHGRLLAWRKYWE